MSAKTLAGFAIMLLPFWVWAALYRAGLDDGALGFMCGMFSVLWPLVLVTKGRAARMQRIADE